jgi:hypothetical protein
MIPLLVLLLLAGEMEIPTRAPDGRQVLQICNGESAIIHLVWKTEQRGAYTLMDLHSGAALLPPLVVVTYGPGEEPDITHTYFLGRDWSSKEFLAAFPEPCALIRRTEQT